MKIRGSVVTEDLECGKYTVVFEEKTGRLYALRYGEAWRELVGDKLVLAMLQEIARLRAESRAAQAMKAR